jgi:hypothetical protein
MNDRWTREEVAGKVDWEGGVSETITGYGLSSDILPKDAPSEIVEAWKRVEESSKDIDLIWRWLETGELPKPL